jgi:hypothetical protein
VREREREKERRQKQSKHLSRISQSRLESSIITRLKPSKIISRKTTLSERGKGRRRREEKIIMLSLIIVIKQTKHHQTLVDHH